MPLLSVDANNLAGPLLRLAFREGMLHRAAVHVANADALLGDETLRATLADHRGPVFLADEAEWPAGETVIPLTVALPALPHSVTIWRDALAGVTPDAAAWAAALAGRYRLAP